ncbi:MAG: glutamate-5-semialdehyde dehydrogenase [Firmicutes bacterium]|nr:glutamate-5-semialdehyde dehydrogenase [Bacillota bacterium]
MQTNQTETNDIKKYVLEVGKKAKAASVKLAKLSTTDKNNILLSCAKALRDNTNIILEANNTDLANAEKNGVRGSLIDRLRLTDSRIDGMADGLEQLAKLSDPIGEVISMKTLPNGLTVGCRRVPMGVIGIIYEARPNVTSDAFGLCLKAGSAVILRGGKEAINSNIATVGILRDTISSLGFDADFLQLIEVTDRSSASEMMRLNGYIDVLIPRGGAGLIQSVVMNSTVPVIETGVGNCHVFIDESADIQMGIDIIINAKVQRPGVCNAAETMLVHEKIADKFIPLACKALREKNVEIRADEKTSTLFSDSTPATEEDWATEYGDYILAVKVVSDIDEAISHIQKYSTGHSECIVTKSYDNSRKFTDEIDSAAVYVNASTRFTDGNEFGFGAEIGISTQKLHARGPMGLKELTTSKYIIFGNGQVRQ